MKRPVFTVSCVCEILSLERHLGNEQRIFYAFNNKHFDPLNAKLNPISYLLALLGTHHILHISRINVKNSPSCEMYNDMLTVRKMQSRICLRAVATLT